MIRATGAALAAEYPGLEVHGIVGDFERHLAPAAPTAPPRRHARRHDRQLHARRAAPLPPRRRASAGPGGALLIGVDLVKDPARIEAAYDDPAGVTAAFNRNVLRVVNRELSADFAPDAFDHVAFFDREHEWIEMRCARSAA